MDPVPPGGQSETLFIAGQAHRDGFLPEEQTKEDSRIKKIIIIEKKRK